MKRFDRKQLMALCAAFLVLDVLIAAVLLGSVLRDRRSQRRDRDALARTVGVTDEMSEEEQQERYAVALGQASGQVTMFGEVTAEEGLMGIYLSNGEENTCGVCIEVYLLETGEKIAASDTVLPGWRLEKLQLEKELAAGEYHCLVRCLFYTMDENISLGTTTRQMLLTVT